MKPMKVRRHLLQSELDSRGSHWTRLYRVCKSENLASVVTNFVAPGGAFDALVSISSIEVPSSCVKQPGSVILLSVTQ